MSTSVVPLSTRYAALSTVINDTATEWIQLVTDHRRNIQEASSFVTITPDVLNSYRYRPGDYLAEVWSIDRSYIWIFLLINDLVTVVDFDDPVTEVYVPSVQYITELRATYRAKLANQAKVDAS